MIFGELKRLMPNYAINLELETVNVGIINLSLIEKDRRLTR